MNKVQKVTVKNEQMNEAKKQVQTDCNELLIVNLSTTDVCLVDKFPVQPESKLLLGGNEGEVIVNSVTVESPDFGNVWFWRKVYV